jgi:hypothetical protein
MDTRREQPRGKNVHLNSSLKSNMFPQSTLANKKKMKGTK